MKKRSKIVIGITIMLAIILLIILKLNRKQNKVSGENISSNEMNLYDENIINQVKSEINATADADMYQIEEEYDGRKILQIKPNIQYETVLAGIIKEDIPTEEEIASLLKNKPNKKGIWISNPSREKFIKILKTNNIDTYAIDEEGYLYSKEENNQENTPKLNHAIYSDKLYIIDISGRCYIRDDLSAEIVEYPFERMDPYQVLEAYQNDNSIILEITENQKQKISNQEILETILLHIE